MPIKINSRDKKETNETRIEHICIYLKAKTVNIAL